MRTAILTLFLLTTLWGSAALACSAPGTVELAIDDTLPAAVWSPFSVAVESIKRGADSGSSCDDLGWVTLQIEGGLAGAGYTFEVVDGNAPRNFGERPTPVVDPNGEGTFTLVWSEDVDDDQPALDFTLRVTPYAPNGEVGDFQDVEISHPGVDGGCSSTGDGFSNPVSLLLFGALVLASRRLK